jgi:flagellar assembly protein FliH
MVKLQKYLFDTDFGSPRTGGSDLLMADDADELDQAIVEAPPPPPPTFSEEELTLVREQSFAGHAAGLAEAETTLNHMLGMAMASCAHHLQGLQVVQAEANEAQSRDAIALALTIVRKLHPTLSARFGLDAVAAVIGDSLAHLHQVARVTIKVHPDLVEAVRDKSDRLAAQTGFEGKLLVAADPGLALGDCRLDWGDGGAVRDQSRSWAEVDRAVTAVLGVLPELAGTDPAP